MKQHYSQYLLSFISIHAAIMATIGYISQFWLVISVLLHDSDCIKTFESHHALLFIHTAQLRGNVTLVSHHHKVATYKQLIISKELCDKGMWLSEFNSGHYSDLCHDNQE